MNIFELIVKEHEEHRALAARIHEARCDPTGLRSLWPKFRDDIVAHADAEEQTLYARLFEDPDSQEQARHGVAEHKKFIDLVEKLDDVSPENSEWSEVFGELRHALEHHMDEEEEDVLPLAKEQLSAEECAELKTKFVDRKSAELTN